MDAKERLKLAIDGSGLNLTDFSKRVGVNYRTLQRYLSGERKLGAEFLADLSDRTDISATWILTGKGGQMVAPSDHLSGKENPTSQDAAPDFVPIQRFSVEASAGPGALVDEETQTGFYAFNRRWLDRRQLDPGSLAVIAVRGDSMEPKLSDGDLILVDRAQRQIADGIAYVLRIDTDLLVKNVQRVRPGVIALLSANALYPPREIDAEGLDGEVEIIGRVVASMHEW